jgi:hypothetical protein
MQNPGYKKAYMANLKAQIKVDNKNLAANKGPINPSTLQYIQNGGTVPMGVRPPIALISKTKF